LEFWVYWWVLIGLLQLHILEDVVLVANEGVDAFEVDLVGL